MFASTDAGWRRSACAAGGIVDSLKSQPKLAPHTRNNTGNSVFSGVYDSVVEFYSAEHPTSSIERWEGGASQLSEVDLVPKILQAKAFLYPSYKLIECLRNGLAVLLNIRFDGARLLV